MQSVTYSLGAHLHVVGVAWRRGGEEGAQSCVLDGKFGLSGANMEDTILSLQGRA